ncbi:MAG: serine protease [Azospirillum sp.]|nr:serine protease [Azospirillum sp.]MCA3264548.1 serine protease [Azospirillum sp.]
MRRTLLAALAACALLGTPARAQVSAEDVLGAVFRLKTYVPIDARTAATLGRERDGSAILIDEGGLLLTIGYLMVEAESADITLPDGTVVDAAIVGYDHDTGFGLLRSRIAARVAKPLARAPADAGAQGDVALIVPFDAARTASPARIVARRPFAGNWEYMVERAIFAAPPNPLWSGAALVDSAGRLLGVGSLIVNDAMGMRAEGGPLVPGNMFVPAAALDPILADLVAAGRSRAPVRPWLGMTLEETPHGLVVARVTPGGPAERAGLMRGDAIAGVKGARAETLIDFYRATWAQGPAGTTVEFETERAGRVRAHAIPSVDRRDQLKLR